MHSTRTALLTALALLASAPAAAQQRQSPLTLGLEGRVALAVPSADWRNENGLRRGSGYGLNLQLGFSRALAAYVGWSQFSFPRSASDSAADLASATDTGLRMGLTGSLPLGSPQAVSPFVLAGLIVDLTDVSATRSTDRGVSEGAIGAGLEMGAGLAVPVGHDLSLTPQLRYRAHGGHYTSSTAPSSVAPPAAAAVSYFVLDLGVRYLVGK